MASDTSVSPIAVPATGLWEGDDGSWPTFYIEAGTPPQVLRVQASTADMAMVLSLNDTRSPGCSNDDDPSCWPQLNLNKSTTWQSANTSVQFTLNNGVSAEAQCGYDSVGLELPPHTYISVPSAPITLYPPATGRMGYLGLTPDSYNNSVFDGRVAFLSHLKQSNNIPSLSYGLAAGAKYRENATASLTLGGYDASRFIATTNASFQIDSLKSDLHVFVQAIILNNVANGTLLPQNIAANIDSTTPYIWLPPESCKLFEKALGIVYDVAEDAYPVNQSLHKKLQSENISISFLLSANASAEPTVNITLPYASFDIEAVPPVTQTRQRYFSIARQLNPDQYTLGKAFLQEAYLIADFERSNFSLFQNSWNTTAKPQLIGVAPVPSPPPQPLTTTASNDSKFVGITIGAISFLILGIGLAFDFLHNKRASNPSRSEEAWATFGHTNPWNVKPEMDGSGRVHGEVDGTDLLPAEADSAVRAEMQGAGASTPGPRFSSRFVAELEGNREDAEPEITTGDIEEVR